jgi:hypothetical protein
MTLFHSGSTLIFAGEMESGKGALAGNQDAGAAASFISFHTDSTPLLQAESSRPSWLKLTFGELRSRSNGCACRRTQRARWRSGMDQVCLRALVCGGGVFV